VSGDCPADKERSRHNASGDDPKMAWLVDHRAAVPVLLHGHDWGRDQEDEQRRQSDVGPTRSGPAQEAPGRGARTTRFLAILAPSLRHAS